MAQSVLEDDYSGDTTALDADKLNLLARLAQEGLDTQAQIADLEAKLKVANENLSRITERAIPTIMDEIGMSDFRLTNGRRITVTDKVRASIPVARKLEAVAWLDEHDLSGMIKRTITISFNRDEEKWANRVEADLRKRKAELRLNKEYKVEPPTLTAWATRTLKEGGEIDPELFGIFVQRRAKIE